MNEESIWIASFADGCIREKVMMEKPYVVTSDIVSAFTDKELHYNDKLWDSYNAHIASRRTFSYPVKEEQDGKELREGIDFEIKQQVTGGRSVKSLEGIPYDYHTYTKEVPIPIDKHPEPVKDEGMENEIISATFEFCKANKLLLMPLLSEILRNTIRETKRQLSSPPEPDSKDEDMRKQIMVIFRDYIHFSPQTESFVVHGATGKLIELFKEWHNKLSSPDSKDECEHKHESGCRHNWFYSPNTFSKYCPSCHKLESYNPPKQKP